MTTFLWASRHISLLIKAHLGRHRRNEQTASISRACRGKLWWSNRECIHLEFQTKPVFFEQMLYWLLYKIWIDWEHRLMRVAGRVVTWAQKRLVDVFWISPHTTWNIGTCLVYISNLLCHLCACQLRQMVTQPRQWSKWWCVVIVQSFYFADVLLLEASTYVLNQRNWTNINQMTYVGNCGHVSKDKHQPLSSPVMFPADPSLRNHWKHPWNSQVVGGSEIGPLLAPKEWSEWVEFFVLGMTPKTTQLCWVLFIINRCN